MGHVYLYSVTLESIKEWASFMLSGNMHTNAHYPISKANTPNDIPPRAGNGNDWDHRKKKVAYPQFYAYKRGGVNFFIIAMALVVMVMRFIISSSMRNKTWSMKCWIFPYRRTKG